MSSPHVSVLLPTHHRPDVIGAAIQSVLDQTFSDFELLVVGDGCLPATVDAVSAFDDSRIRFFELEKAPFYGYANRNIALREAKGELIAFASDDDILFPDHLERMIEKFANPQKMWGYSRPLWVSDEGIIVPFFANLLNPMARKRFMQIENFIPAGCVVHRRICLEKYGYWSEDVEKAADWELWKRILSGTGPASIVFERAPTHMHFRAERKTGKRWGPLPLEYLLSMQHYSSAWPSALALKIDPNIEPPQSQILKKFQDKQAHFEMQIRHAVNRLQDNIAWESTLDTLFK